MESTQKTKPTIICIEEPTSEKQIRSLNPHGPIDELNISSQRIFDLKRAKALSSWQSIRSISIVCPTTKAALCELLSISGLVEINILYLKKHGNLKSIPRPPSLKILRCGWLRSGDLMTIAKLSNLTTLEAQNCTLSNEILKKLVGMKNLTKLNIEASNLDDEMAETLATSKRISKLDIGATVVGRRGLESICGMSQLRELDIWALDIQESDLDLLSSLSNLEYLSVGGYDDQTVLTAEGVLPRIAKLPSLKHLWLDGIPMTKDQIGKLKERYEHVQVTFAE